MGQVNDILRDIGLSGGVDILLMSGLVYGALAWMQENRMRNLLRGVVTVVALYLAARLFELELTATSLEAILVIVAVAAIVLYGGEVRRLVERMAMFNRARTNSEPSDTRVTELARVLFDLAKARIGALVVVEGQDPVDNLIDGGVALDGTPSEPLLQSIFHPSSMGHDGALILAGGRIQTFGCHLPLSTEHGVLGWRGTRHAAALGLSEQCDALCIAVSEERGTVTICEKGVLEEVAHADALVERLVSFGRGTRPRRSRKIRVPRVQPATLAASLFIATLSWLVLVHGARPVHRTYELALTTTNPSAGTTLQAVHPEEVRVTVTGAGHDFYLVSQRSLRVSVPLADMKPGQHAITLDASNVKLPRGLTLVSVEPPRVSVSLVKQ